jgi:CRISPR-associated protein Csd1
VDRALRFFSPDNDIVFPEETGATEVDRVSANDRAEILRRLGKGLPVTEAWPELEPEVRLYVLALALNRSRLAVSFFLFGAAREFLEYIQEYYLNLAVTRRFPDWEPEFPSVWQIARAVLGRHKKMKDVKRLGEDLLEAGLSGRAYPAYLLPMALQRLRSGDDFNSVLAGLIKAMLIRNFKQEVSMSLNPEHPSPAYQLGRLFALLAGVQRKAIGPNINADIRDKYYGSASAAPAQVFPLLLRNAQNHISKASAYGYDKMIREVLDHIDGGFPAHLNLKDQGYFALGYYHQRADRAVRQDEEVNPVQE